MIPEPDEPQWLSEMKNALAGAATETLRGAVHHLRDVSKQHVAQAHAAAAAR